MKFFCAALMATLFTLTIQAQARLALSGGYNHAGARIHKGSQLQSTSTVPGYNLGLRVQTEFEPPLYFTGLLHYSKRGYKYQVRPDSSVQTGIHYIEMIPTLNLNIASGSQAQLSLFAGPMLGIAFSGKQTQQLNGQSHTDKMKFSFSGNYGYANLAIHTGAAIHFNRFFVEGSYHLGLSSINNDEEFDDTNIKLRGFSVNLGYWLQ